MSNGAYIKKFDKLHIYLENLIKWHLDRNYPYFNIKIIDNLWVMDSPHHQAMAITLEKKYPFTISIDYENNIFYFTNKQGNEQ